MKIPPKYFTDPPVSHLPSATFGIKDSLTMFHHAYLSSIVDSKAVGCMPVGQLDINTTGLMLFTDDSRVIDGFCKPRNCVKFYRVGYDRPEDVEGLKEEEIKEVRKAREMSAMEGRCCSYDGIIPYSVNWYDMRPFNTAIGRND